MINHFRCSFLFYHFQTAKSPIFSQMAATFTGISTIRATTQAPERLTGEFDDFQNVHSAVWQILMSINTGGCSKAINAEKKEGKTYLSKHLRFLPFYYSSGALVRLCFMHICGVCVLQFNHDESGE